MAEINLNLDNQNIINDYFKDLTCDDYKESIFKGGQSFADQALNSLDISGYAKKRNNVYPSEKRGSSYLSPYIRHGLLSLEEVWNHVEEFKYEDKSKFRDELLWQEFSRHLYAIIGKKKLMEFANNSFISSTFWTEKIGYVAALKTIEIMEKIGEKILVLYCRLTSNFPIFNVKS